MEKRYVQYEDKIEQLKPGSFVLGIGYGVFHGFFPSDVVKAGDIEAVVVAVVEDIVTGKVVEVLATDVTFISKDQCRMKVVLQIANNFLDELEKLRQEDQRFVDKGRGGVE